VLLVLDGLGWSAVQDHAPSMPRLDAHEGHVDHDRGAVDHRDRAHLDRHRLGARAARVVGYRMLVGDEVLNVLALVGLERRPACRNPTT
jgi:hypothetical protein